MENQYINQNRYKKSGVRKRRDNSTVKRKIKNNVKKKSVEKITAKKVINKRKSKYSKQVNLVICIMLLILIGAISRAILKEDNEPFIPNIFSNQENEQVITLGVITTNDLRQDNPNNIIQKELNKYTENVLLEISEDYSLNYKIISKIDKITNKEYVLHINKDFDVEPQTVKDAIEIYAMDKSNIHYTNLKNISLIKVEEDKLRITLEKEDAYFVYSLEIPVNSLNEQANYYLDETSTPSMLKYVRSKHTNENLPKMLIVKRYKDMYAAVEAYKHNEINMFVTNSENVQNILGKYEYNIKTYRNGEGTFLFGNTKSTKYMRPEVRRAIAYAINRDSIIKDILKSKGDKIDLPFIYNNVKYKYDIYAAENLLLTNKYSKTDKVYTKIEDGKRIDLNLTLIVNKQDDIKVEVAKRISNNLKAIGINMEVQKLSEAKIKDRINNSDYDLLLASVDLNYIPDIEFLNNYIYQNEKIEQAKDKVLNSKVEELSINIENYQNALSEEVACIGIYSDVSYLVYGKDILNNNVTYMNLFKDILN